MVTNQPRPPAQAPPPGGATAADPVDLATGLFVYEKTHLAVHDAIDATVKRTYRPGDANSYDFGVGTTSPYDTWLYQAPSDEGTDLVLPDGARVRFERTNPAAPPGEAAWEAQRAPGVFFGAKIVTDPDSYRRTVKLRDGTALHFPSSGQLLAISDRHGRRLTVSRENGQAGRIRQLTTPSGRWIRFAYDSANRIVEARDHAGRSTSYAYDGGGRLASATDPKGRTTTYDYDGQGRMTTVTDPRDITYLTNVYDGSSDRVKEQTLAGGGTYRFDYQLANGTSTKTTVTDPRGTVREVSLGADRLPVSQRLDAGGAAEKTLGYERDTQTGQLTAVVDPLGRRSELSYDGAASLIELTELAGTPQATTTSFTYESTFNQLATVTDPLGHTTSYSHDSLGRVTSVEDPTGRQSTVGYDGDGPLPVTVTDPAGNATSFGYSGSDVVSVSDPLGQTTSIARVPWVARCG